MTSNPTPYSTALYCLADYARRYNLPSPRMAVGRISDYTGTVSSDGGRQITGGASLMANSALAKAGARIVERYDTSVSELELRYAHNKLIGDDQPNGAPQDAAYRRILAGQVPGSDFYVVGGITEVNYNIRSGGFDIAGGEVGQNGGSGLLVTRFEAYADYQENRGSNTAWTWEHQAMTRARMVPPRSPAAPGALALQAAEPPESVPLRAVQARAGEAGAAALSPEGAAPGLGSGPAAGRMVPPPITSPDAPADNLVARCDAVRHAVITAPRDQAALRGEIVAMREKMRAAHPVKQGLFDVKHSPGGMVDAEFVTQYLVLAHTARHPGLEPNLGNIALLRRAEDAGLLPAGVGQAAADAYRALRRVQHRARLDEQPTQVAPDTLAGERAAIQRLWQVVFE